MKMDERKCKNCTGKLTVSPDGMTAECPFCGTVYDLRENSQVVNHVDHLHADVVSFNSDQSAESRLKAADAFLKLKKYSEAGSNYRRVVELTPQDYRGWWGVIVSWTEDFTRRLRSERNDIAFLEDYAKSVEAFAPIDISKNLLGRYRNYIASQRQLNESEKSSIRTRIDHINKELMEVQSEENGLLTQQSNINTSIQKKKGSGANPFGCATVCIAVFGSVFIVPFLLDFVFKTRLDSGSLMVWYLVAAIILYVSIAAIFKGKQIRQENTVSKYHNNGQQIASRLQVLRMRKHELNLELAQKENEMRGYL